MDFNSNDEYLKAFPLNFGSKLESFNKMDRLFDLQAHRIPSKNPQIMITMENIEATRAEMPELVCLDEDIECVEKQGPIQVDLDNAKNKGDELLKEHEVLSVCEEDLAPARDMSCLVQSAIDEPMPEMVDMALAMEVQRDCEMVFGKGDCKSSVETMLSLQAIQEATVFDTEVNELPSTTGTMEERTKDCKIPFENLITTNAIKNPSISLDNTDHYEVEKSILVEVTEAATMKDEICGMPTTKEFVEGTQIITEYERSITNIDIVESNAMDTETPLYVQYRPPTIEIEVVESTVTTVDTLGQIEFVEKTLKALAETSENVDVDQIEIKEPITLEVIEKTNIRTKPKIQFSQNELSEYTQIEAEVFGTEDSPIPLQIIEETTIKAKAICQNEEETLFAMNVVESTNTNIIGLDEDLGTCFEANVNKIVDSIMNDIAGIEVDIEAENQEADIEANMESNTKHQKTFIHGKSIGIEIEATCQDHAQPSGRYI